MALRLILVLAIALRVTPLIAFAPATSSEATRAVHHQATRPLYHDALVLAECATVLAPPFGEPLPELVTRRPVVWTVAERRLREVAIGSATERHGAVDAVFGVDVIAQRACVLQSHGVSIKPIVLTVNPSIAFAPATLTISVRVHPEPSDRQVQVVVDGESFSRLSRWTIDPEHCPALFSYPLKDLPAGSYEVRAEIGDWTSVRASDRATVEVH